MEITELIVYSTSLAFGIIVFKVTRSVLLWFTDKNEEEEVRGEMPRPAHE